MVQFMQLPALQANRLLDFSPVNNAVDKIGNALRYRDETNYQRGMDAKREARAASAHSSAMADREERRKREQVETFGKQALAVQQIHDPARRAAIWGRLVQQHPDRASLAPEYMDPTTGPQMVAAEAGQFMDELDRRKKEADISLAEANAQRARALAANPNAGAESPAHVREWEHFNKLSPEDQQRYITMKRSVPYLNAGTEFVQPNPVDASAAPRTVPIDVAGKERQQEIGSASGKANAAFPVVEASSKRMFDTVDSILADPNLSGVTGMVGGRIPRQMQTEVQAETQSRIDQALGQTFLQAYNDLRGAGQISNAEGQSAKEAYNRLQTQTMGTEAYKKALLEFKAEMQNLYEIAKRKAGVSPQGAAPSNPYKDRYGLE